ncbi:MAG: hypothetical protein IT384_16035 [Deltaproteobacteria bacterium]|nr:hypothetical protein [Deltaproteobacteria bacterium]
MAVGTSGLVFFLISAAPLQVVITDVSGVEPELAEQIATRIASDLEVSLGVPVRARTATAMEVRPEAVSLSIAGGPLRIRVRAVWRSADGGDREAFAILTQLMSEWDAPISALVRLVSAERVSVSARDVVVTAPVEAARGSAFLPWIFLGAAVLSGVSAAVLAGSSRTSSGPPAIHSSAEHERLARGAALPIAGSLAGASVASLVLAVVLGLTGS